MEELRSTEARLLQIVEQKEEAFAKLNAEYEKLRNHVGATVIEKEKILQEAPVYSIVHKKADSGKKLTDDELSQLHSLVREVLPDFYQLISSKRHSLNETEFNVCVLFRLHVRASGVAALLGKGKSTITKASGSVMENVFKEDGLSHELIEKLKDIC